MQGRKDATPIDLNRILRLRKAISSGTYVVDSMRIANALLREWGTHGPRRVS